MATSVSSQRFDDDSQSYEVVFDGIDAIVESMNREIDDKWLGSLEVPMATDQAMLKISKLIAWAIMAHDGSVDPTNPGKTLEYLVPDKELPLPPIDTWARGTVPVRKLEEPHSDFKVNKENQDGEKTPSVSSFRTSNSGTAKTSNSKTSYMSKASKARGAQKEEELDPTGQIVELDDPDEEFGDLDGNGELFQTLNRLKKEKSATDEQREQTADEFAQLQAEIDKQLADMKTKKYAVDASGKVIPLQAIKPETLPPYSVPLNTKINSPRDGAKAKAAAGKESGEDKRKKKVIRVAGSRAIDDDAHFKASNTLATVLSSGEAIAPQAGVALRVGGNTREGPSLSNDPSKPSRKQYLARSQQLGASSEADLRAQSGVAGGPSALDLEGSEGSLGVGFPDSSFSPTPGGLPQSMMHSVRFQDVDPLEGGRRVLTQQEQRALQRDQSDEELGLGPKMTSGQVQTAVLPRPKDPSQVLFDYPTDKTGAPRDRDLPMNQRPPSERKHQLAPPVGKVSVRQKDGLGSPTASFAGSVPSVADRSAALSPSKPQQSQGLVRPVNPALARAMF